MLRERRGTLDCRISLLRKMEALAVSFSGASLAGTFGPWKEPFCGSTSRRGRQFMRKYSPPCILIGALASSS
eukprot:3145011-Alexandrium_andersonii.AAC.1